MRAAAALIVAAAFGAAPAAHAQIELAGPGGAASLSVTSYRDIPFHTVIRQQYDFSCGSAALATLLRFHYGRDVDERTVFESMFALGDGEQIQRNGFSLLDMKRYLETHGFQADGFRLTIDDLAASKSPAVVMIDTQGYRHFVVLKGVDADRVLIGDPARGLLIQSREEFAATWNGVAFMIKNPGARFNQASEWSPWTASPLDLRTPPDSLASFTQQLPPLYQITTRFSLDPFFR